MKISFFAAIFLFSLMVAIPASGQVAPPRPDPISKDPLTNELVGLSAKIFDAGIKGDRDTIDKLLDKDYLEIDAEGFLRDKEWNLTNFLPSDAKMTFQIADPRIRKREEFALLYYTLNVKYEFTTNSADEEKPTTKTFNPQLRVVDTYIRTKEGWRLIASSRVQLRS